MQHSEELEKARTLVDEFRSGMLVTLGMEDRPHARPMMIASVDDDFLISFVTSLDSLKVDEIRRRGNVALTLQSSGAFVALTGYATVVTDPEEKKKAWHPVAELWFQDHDDPEAALVQLQPQSIEYWDNRGVNSLRFAFEAARAAATGSQMQAPPRTHGQVEL